jgi:hypothetical protein
VASVKVDGRTLPVTVSDSGVIRAEFPLGTKAVPSAAVFEVEITARTRPSGVPLGPIRDLSRLKVELPPAFPTVGPGSVDFGSVEGVGARDAELRITGSDLGETKVCLTNSSFVVPGVDTKVSVTSDSPCVTVPRGGERTLIVTLAPGVSADGVAEGDIVLDVTSADGEQVQLSIPGSLDMARAVDQGKRWTLIAALIFGALLIPALLLVGSNVLLLGKFSMSSGTRIASVPVRIRPDGVTRLHGGAFVEPDDLHNAPFAGTKRASRMNLAGTSLALRATRLFSLRAPRGVASVAGTRKLVSGFGSKEGDVPHEAPVGLGSVDATFVSIDNLTGEQEATGRLVVAIPAGVDVAGANERARLVVRDVDWPRILEELAVRPEPLQEDLRREPVTQDEPPPDGSKPKPWPWEDDPPSSLGAAPPAPSKRRRSPGAQLPPPASPRSDALPPLPLFLQDKD